MTPKRHSAEERLWFAAVASLEYCVLCGRFGVQVAHRNQGRGIGQKAPPWETAALCQQCHDGIDNGGDFTQDERRALMDMAIVRTHSALADRGVLRLAA